jgi:dTDP-4-amino-4,6-dideoxygalactose transaminase
MVITSDENAAERIRMLRNHGSKVKYYHTALGYNSRLDEIQAAIVRVKLKRIDVFNDMRRHNAELYRTGIMRDDITLPVELSDCMHVYHQFTLKSALRDTVAEKLRENDIASAIYYPVPLHRQDVFDRLDKGSDDLKISEDCARTVISLPMFPELTEAEIKQICEVINNVS